MAFFQTYLSAVDSAAHSFLNDTVSILTTNLAPTASTLIAIYTMFWGWAMIRGMIDEPILDGFTRIVRMSFIVAVATIGGYFNTYLANWLWDTPTSLGLLLTTPVTNAGGPPASTAYNFLDSTWDQIYAFGQAFAAKADTLSTLGVPDLKLLACAVMIWVAGGIAVGYAAFLVLLAKVALAIVIALGPIFVLLTIFEATKNFFNSWIGQAANYILLTALAAGAMALLLHALHTMLDPILSPVAPNYTAIPLPYVVPTNALPCVIMCVVIFLTLLQVPSIASSLGGGAAVSTLGAVGAIYSRLKGAAAGARNLLTGQTLANMRMQRYNRQRMARWASNNPSTARQAASYMGSGGANAARIGSYAAGRAAGSVYRRITQGRVNRVSSG